MNLVKNEKLENNSHELQFSIDAEAFNAAIAKAFKREAGKYNIPGFRKGKAPRHMIEKMFGADVFHYDAINDLFPEAYEAAVAESGVEPVDRPEVDIVSASTEDGVVLKAVVTVKPEMKVGEYKGLKATKKVNTVEDAAVEAEIERMRERNARIITREGKAQDGDVTDIDFEGFVDGVAFEGGKGEHFSLTLGSGQFIPGFEEQVAGHNIGESFDVTVTFPEDYQMDEYAGKEAVFHCSINSISHEELPELDDEFVKDTSDFDTVDELKADVRKKLEENAENAASNSFENAVTLKLIEKVTDPIPHCMFEHRADSLMNQFANQLKAQGISMDLYLQYTGMTQDALKETYLERAENEVKLRLALEKVAELEKLEVSDEDLEAEVNRLAEENNLTAEDVKKRIYLEDLREDMLATKAMELVKEAAVATDAPEETEEAPAEETAATEE